TSCFCRSAIRGRSRHWPTRSGSGGTAASVAARMQRILSAEGLRPHKVRMWLHSPDPDFRSKVERICRLYCEPPDDAIVLCIDEKPMQALARRYATSLGPDAGVRRDFEYLRRGVCHLLAAFDVRTGEVMG